MSKYTWPLAINTFNLWDRLKICGFFLDPSNRWTQDKYVKEYEEKAARFVGCKYAVFVSSGSTANQLVAQWVKETFVRGHGQYTCKEGHRFKNEVIVNAVTWQTNVSPWVREGFKPVFIDVNLNDFCLDYKKLDNYLKKNRNYVAAVFPTSVLGFTPDMDQLRYLSYKYTDVYFAMDCCENFLSSVKNDDLSSFWGEPAYDNICSFCTSTTSTYIAHQISNGQEGGFIFTNSEDEYKYFLLARAHGLSRNLVPYNIDRTEYTNILVDPQFDFQELSSNYRNTDIGAFMGLLDFAKIEDNIQHREEIFESFRMSLDSSKYHLPYKRGDVAFCLPIIVKGEDKAAIKERVQKVKDYLDSKLIERRSFVSGNMLRQKPYQQYGNYKKFKNAEYLNGAGMYIGLHGNVTKQSIENLCFDLNLL